MTSMRDFLAIYIVHDRESRQTGRTTALLEAAKKIDAFFIVESVMKKRSIDYKKTVTFYDITSLRGSRDPIIIDHYTLNIIFDNLFRYINNLEEKLENIKDILNKEFINKE